MSDGGMIFMGGGDPAEMMVGMAMGRVVGGQMASMMNNSMAATQQNTPPAMPTAVPTATPPTAAQYNVAVNGQLTGPFDMDTLAKMAHNGQLTPQSPVWKQGMDAWAAAGTVPELRQFFGTANGTVGTAGAPHHQHNEEPPEGTGYLRFPKESTMHVYDESNFYSTDRLMEFGMSTAAAQQMVNSMNHAMQYTFNSGVMNSMQTPEQKQRLDQQLQSLHTQALQAQEAKRIPTPPAGAENPASMMSDSPPLTVYYAMIDGKQAGPFCETELGRLINDKKVCNKTYIWHTGLKEWTAAEHIPAVLRLAALVPPRAPPAAPPPTPPPAPPPLPPEEV